MQYIGNAKYCYANSAAILLSSIGETVSPSTIEVLTGVGLGATMQRNNGLLYFNNQTLQSDLGITQALSLLGFTSSTKVSKTPDDFPIDDVRNELQKGPIIIGPLDMGHLTYNPNHKNLFDADHFVVVYAVEGDKVYLHDPAEFPHVWLSVKNLQLSWQANNVSYRQGYYRYIYAPKRMKNPSEKEIYKNALQTFKGIYTKGMQQTDRAVWIIGKDAIQHVAANVKEHGLTEREVGHFVYFALSLAAKRALDFATFFEPYNKTLAELKNKQARLFGESHSFVRVKDWIGFAESLEELAQLEENFQETILTS